MPDLLISVTRTWAAIGAGALITWAIRQGVHVDPGVQQPLTEVLAAAIGAVYYLGVRLLERLWPRFGVLLGIPRAPAYPASSSPSTR